MTRTALAMLAGLLLAAQCDNRRVDPPITPEPIPTPAPTTPKPPESQPDCESSCWRLSAMSCPEAEPTDAGASCVDVCNTIQASGTVRYPVECVTSSRSCADAEECFR